MTPELRERLEALLSTGNRTILGIVGSPGSGKSTLAAQVVEEVGALAVVVPMDGFHLAQTELVRIDRADRKGAPDTFDAAGYVALLRRLRAEEGTVYAPEYRRDLRNPVAGAIAVPAQVRLVVTEGNYLLLDVGPWAGVRERFDEVWFCGPDDALRLERLVRRHERFGKDPRSALAWATGPDGRNAVLVEATRHRADLVVGPDVLDLLTPTDAG